MDQRDFLYLVLYIPTFLHHDFLITSVPTRSNSVSLFKVRLSSLWCLLKTYTIHAKFHKVKSFWTTWNSTAEMMYLFFLLIFEWFEKNNVLTFSINPHVDYILYGNNHIFFWTVISVKILSVISKILKVLSSFIFFVYINIRFSIRINF